MNCQLSIVNGEFDLSIVIVSYNVQGLLQACLRSIRNAQPYPERSRRKTIRNTQIQIIVIDNASSDGSAQMVRGDFSDVRLIANESNAGFAAATNQGVRASTGRHVLVLNPDAEVLDGTLAKLVGFLDHHPDYAAAGAGLVYPDGSFQHSAFRFPGVLQNLFEFFPIHHRLSNSRLNGRYPPAWYARGQPFDVDHPLGACLAVRRETIDQVGLLDEGFFMYCEEIDWCWRMKAAGWKVACVPAAQVIHHAGASTRQFRDEMFVALWRSRSRLFEKHLGPVRRRIIASIVRLGLQRERLRATNLASSGKMPVGELVSRLAVYEEVAELSRRDREEQESSG
ncbi:MAG: N-acetylglucosaminyl-diphospho-decaprenol L-rhamnosyltransferase [Anaerolineales bacterium]|nr:N-acetylglucosaminyl-diphospho-decaprenol L-rhamnosyltransferase [Anaerolineales bacterium]